MVDLLYQNFKSTSYPKQVQTLEDILSEKESQVTKLSQDFVTKEEECFKSQKDVRFFQRKLESLVRKYCILLSFCLLSGLPIQKLLDLGKVKRCDVITS